MRNRTMVRVLLRVGALAIVVGWLGLSIVKSAVTENDWKPEPEEETQTVVASPSVVPVHGKPVAKWKVTTPPKTGSDEWYAANNSETSWKVSVQNGAVYADAVKRDGYEKPKLPFLLTDKEMLGGELSAIKVADGWLIGRNAGEWGGDLWWYAPDGKTHYKVSDEQIHGFLQTKDGLFAFEGLEHLTLNMGHLLTLNRDVWGRWRTTTLADLNGAPEAFTTHSLGGFLVATPYTLLHVGQNGTVAVLVEKAFWCGLYCTSIVEAANGDIYIGMRQGVARVRQQERQGVVIEWLLPNE